MASAQAIETKRFAPVSRTMREAVLAEAEECWAAQDVRNLVQVIAKRLGASTDEVARALVGLVLEYQREAASLKVGLQSALAMAQEAGAEVWREAG